MSSSAAQIAHAAVEYSTFASLRLGRTVQSVVARLIRFWDSRNVNKNVEFMGIRLLLLEEMDSVIHAFTPANRASHYRPSLKAGCIVRLERFEVARVAHMYKVTEHQFLICFLPFTRLGEVHTDAPVIKSERFMMRRYDQLQVLANTNLELPDVVGEIRSVQGSDLSNDSSTTRVVVRFLIEPNVTVYLTLWDEAASTFRGLLKSGDKSKAVMLVTTVNPKLFGGNLYLISTQGTRFFFDPKLPEITEFLSSVGAASSPAFTCVDTLEGIKRKEHVSIGELNAFISNSDEQTQEADFLCKALVVGVNQENGWFFISCNFDLISNILFKRFTLIVSDQTIGKFSNVRFCVELAVDDGKYSAAFVVFDKEMTKLTGKEADVLALDEDLNGEGDELPRCLEELAGKEFEHDDNILPNREAEVTLAASSSGQSVLGNRTGVEYAEANPPEVEGAQKKRKLSSE
uniref:Replication protein A 70 kDa DNA-binding subunit B/D first OB fold domain-containing protein n=1 Tax=Brassica oleracea var. oleracea TaxID=109376 RepID=A0A0D3BI73_BRAOL